MLLFVQALHSFKSCLKSYFYLNILFFFTFSVCTIAEFDFESLLQIELQFCFPKWLGFLYWIDLQMVYEYFFHTINYD